MCIGWQLALPSLTKGHCAYTQPHSTRGRTSVRLSASASASAACSAARSDGEGAQRAHVARRVAEEAAREVLVAVGHAPQPEVALRERLDRRGGDARLAEAPYGRAPKSCASRTRWVAANEPNWCAGSSPSVAVCARLAAGSRTEKSAASRGWRASIAARRNAFISDCEESAECGLARRLPLAAKSSIHAAIIARPPEVARAYSSPGFHVPIA
ncbi:hypothetical protein AB1Y20_001948 [Prymnesium parvum]|uniref:Uncharacterized protein n=1 Tax=Prymnesium parvum TaxID=97485 RepID=A0AB34J757_PRYPA